MLRPIPGASVMSNIFSAEPLAKLKNCNEFPLIPSLLMGGPGSMN
jgi:hypothetical protein